MYPIIYSGSTANIFEFPPLESVNFIRVYLNNTLGVSGSQHSPSESTFCFHLNIHKRFNCLHFEYFILRFILQNGKFVLNCGYLYLMNSKHIATLDRNIYPKLRKINNRKTLESEYYLQILVRYRLIET